MNMSETKIEKLSDQERLAEIARLDLLSDEVDDILNDFAEQAADEFDLPVGMVTVVLDGAQIWAGGHGLDDLPIEGGGIPVEWSFCANSVESREPFILPDAKANEKTKDNPAVQAGQIRCYAGAPMISSNGFVLGNFCVSGTEEREFTESEIERLKEYAQKAVQRIEARA
jgi:GAF domain-containing protein